MSSFIDRWINRMSDRSAHNSRPSNTGNTVSIHTLQSRSTGNSPVYFKQKSLISSSPNCTNFPVSYFEEEAVIPKLEFEKMMTDGKQISQTAETRRKSSVASMESDE